MTATAPRLPSLIGLTPCEDAALIGLFRHHAAAAIPAYCESPGERQAQSDLLAALSKLAAHWGHDVLAEQLARAADAVLALPIWDGSDEVGW